MLGAIIGDIAGSRYEFNPTNDYNFEIFAPGSDFTDDSICTIAVADAIIRNVAFGQSIHRWCNLFPAPKGGYGGRFAQWVMSDNPRPYGSFGNGSAMRVSPVGWLNTADEVEKAAVRSAECTHNHPEGIKGAVAVARAVYDCQKMRKSVGNRDLTAEEKRHALSNAILLYCNEVDKFTINLLDYQNRFDETCMGTVPVALWIVLISEGFEDAIRRAVSLDADADTLGAIVGGIAEAVWGIPEWMEIKAMEYLTPNIINVVNAFKAKYMK